MWAPSEPGPVSVLELAVLSGCARGRYHAGQDPQDARSRRRALAVAVAMEQGHARFLPGAKLAGARACTRICLRRRVGSTAVSQPHSGLLLTVSWRTQGMKSGVMDNVFDDLDTTPVVSRASMLLGCLRFSVSFLALLRWIHAT